MSLLPPSRPPHHARLTHLLSSAYLISATSPSAAAHLLSTHYSQAYSRDITTTLPRGSGGQVLGGNGSGGGCKRCGAVWVLGWNCMVGGGGGVVKRGRRRSKKIEMKRKGRGNEEKATEGDGEAGPRQKWVEWTCSGCGYVAKGELGSAATKVNGKKEKENTAFLPQITPAPLPIHALTPPIIPQKSIATLEPAGIPGHPSRRPPVATTVVPSPVPAQSVAPQISTPLQSANQRAKERKKRKNNSLHEMLAAKREREAAGGGGKGLGGMDLMDLMKLG